MNFYLYDRTVLLVLSGSRAYGFNNDDSDWDYRGVVIPPMSTYIGVLPKFQQIVDTDKSKHVWKHYPDGLVKPESDMQVMEFVKFVTLAADANPSILEILFSEDIIYKKPIVNLLIDNRGLFLSKRAKARFSGYAYSQLKRIRLHKKWLNNPPTHQPTRSEFGLPETTLISSDQIGAAESMIKKNIESFMIDQTDLNEHTKIDLGNSMERMMQAIWCAINTTTPYPIGLNMAFETFEDALMDHSTRNSGLSENFIEVLRRERQYKTAKKNWDNYQTWLAERNPSRAALEAKFGYDTKFAVHLVRLLKMCREILTEGKLLVKRPDAEELRAIRAGAWTYERVCAFAEEENNALNELVKASSLPDHPDMNAIQSLVFEMVTEFNGVKI